MNVQPERVSNSLRNVDAASSRRGEGGDLVGYRPGGRGSKLGASANGFGLNRAVTPQAEP